MQIVLHPSSQEQGTGNGDTLTEPNVSVRALIVSITGISVNLLGNITFKVQHSLDGSAWVDVPNFATAGLSATGSVTVGLSPAFATFDNIRVVWTFSNANSVTFTATVTGDK